MQKDDKIMNTFMSAWITAVDETAGKHVQSVYDYPIFNSIVFEDIRLFIKHVPFKSKVLDYGCGRGVNSYLLAQYPYDVHGIELSEPQSDELRSNYSADHNTRLRLWKRLKKQCKNKKLNFTLYSGRRMPYKAGMFDAVLGNAVLEHVDDLDASVAEISRVLKKGGTFYISRTPNKLSYVEFMGKICGFITHDNKFFISEMKKVLERHGLRVRFAEYMDFFPSNLPVFNDAYQRLAHIQPTIEKALRRTPAKYIAHHMRIIATKK